MSRQFESIVQSPSRPINHGKVVRQMPIQFKDFPETAGVHCLFLDGYKQIPNAQFEISRVPQETDKSTLDKRNYYCIDVKQSAPRMKNAIIVPDEPDIMRGFVVQNPRQTVFFSATKNQGFFMVTKHKDKNVTYLRPFLCGSIIKKKPQELSAETLAEGKPAEDVMSKVMKAKKKVPMEIFLAKTTAVTTARERKEESEFYEDSDRKVERNEVKKIKQQKRQAVEDYEEGNVDDEDLFEKKNLVDEEDDD